MGSRKTFKIFLTGLFLLSLTGLTAGQPAQSHPLSEIIPIDTDLGMNGYQINNVSQLSLDQGGNTEGLVLEDLTITDDEREQRLVLDTQNDEWRIESSDLNLSYNEISGFFGGPCSAGQFAVDIRNDGEIGCVSAAQELQDEYVNRNGDTMTGSLDMQSNPVLGLNRLETSGSGVTITDSGNNDDLLTVRESGNTDLIGSNLEGVRNLRLVDSGNTDQYTLVYDENNNRLALSNAGEDVLRIDDSTNNLILPGGGLDMRNSNIVNFFDSACAEGDVMVQVNSDGSFQCVDATGEVQNDFVNRNGDTMTGSLDMQDNAIISPGNVDGVDVGSPGNAIGVDGNQYSIPTDAIQTDELDQSDSYSLDWNNLAVSQSDITVNDLGEADANLDMNGYNLNSLGSINNYYGSACPPGEVMVDVKDDGSFGCISVDNEIQDTYVNRNGDTMTGSLGMGGNRIQNIGTSGVNFRSSGSLDLEDQSLINTNQIISDSDGLARVQFSSGVDLEVGNGGGTRIDALRTENGGKVSIPNGNLDMRGNSITSFFGSACPSGEVVADVNDDGSYGCVNIDTEIQDTYVNRNGDTMTGSLDMQNNPVLDIDWADSDDGPGSGLDADQLDGVERSNLDWGNMEVSQSDITVADLGPADANLDINGNSITDFFGSACSSGNVAVHVNDDGTIDCVDATSEVQDDFVNRNGDTMTGSLDMQNNDIVSAGLVNGIDVGSQGNALTEDGSNRIAVSSNSISLTELDEGDIDDRYVQLSGDVMSGTLDMNGNSITRFFGSACPSGEVVADVNSDGTYDCVNLDNEVQDTYVNRNGDTMTGTLDMKDNNIDQVGTINSDGTTMNVGGDVVSSGTVEASADLKTGSGRVTSSSEMCIGNQC